ncbi:hypothetical protein ACPRNU_02000 [Chromobacterium vaccinii]|uniref:hypothetical protein n=1 Tax=Chromobacterium vaccinii TaxID=1108595 RepID=UPI003C78687A
MEQNKVNTDIKRAVDLTMQATACLSGTDRSEYLTAVLAVSLGALRAAEGDLFAHRFLRSAIAELGSPPERVLVNPADPDFPGIAVNAPTGAVDPGTLSSVTELRMALKRANELVLYRGEVMAAMRAALAEIASQVGDLVAAHLQHDAERLHQLMNDLCEKHVVVNGKPSHSLH